MTSNPQSPTLESDDDGQLPIPREIYEPVLQWAFDIFNASEAGDERARWRLYNELHDFVHERAAAGPDHPFLWGTLADHTTDDLASLPFYRRALALAQACGARHDIATLLLELARRHRMLGLEEQAMQFAWDANEYAIGLSDLDVRREISQFLASKDAY